MPAQAGKDLLLKIDPNSDGSFITVAGLRSSNLTFNTASVDVTTMESAGRWRELLSGGGLRTAQMSGSGVFKDEAADEHIRGAFFQGAVLPWRAILPDFGVVEGPFQITNLSYAGDHDGEATYDLTLESAGALSFTAS